jgi:hypothetical protein
LHNAFDGRQIANSLFVLNDAQRLLVAIQSTLMLQYSEIEQNLGSIEFVAENQATSGGSAVYNAAASLTKLDMHSFKCTDNTGLRAACLFIGGKPQNASITHSTFSSPKGKRIGMSRCYNRITLHGQHERNSHHAPLPESASLVSVVDATLLMQNCSFEHYRTLSQDGAALVLRSQAMSRDDASNATTLATALANPKCTATLRQVRFTSIIAFRGAPLSALDVALTIDNCYFYRNYGRTAGAVKFVDLPPGGADSPSSNSSMASVVVPHLDIHNSHFDANLASSDAGAVVIRSNRNITISNSDFAYNFAEYVWLITRTRAP